MELKWCCDRKTFTPTYYWETQDLYTILVPLRYDAIKKYGLFAIPPEARESMEVASEEILVPVAGAQNRPLKVEASVVVCEIEMARLETGTVSAEKTEGQEPLGFNVDEAVPHGGTLLEMLVSDGPLGEWMASLARADTDDGYVTAMGASLDVVSADDLPPTAKAAGMRGASDLLQGAHQATQRYQAAPGIAKAALGASLRPGPTRLGAASEFKPANLGAPPGLEKDLLTLIKQQGQTLEKIDQRLTHLESNSTHGKGGGGRQDFNYGSGSAWLGMTSLDADGENMGRMARGSAAVAEIVYAPGHSP